MVRELRIRKSSNHAEGSVPPCPREEVLYQVGYVTEQRIDRGPRQIFRRRPVRPVNQKWLPDNVVSWNKAPVAAIE